MAMGAGAAGAATTTAIDGIEQRDDGLVVRFAALPDPVTVSWRWLRDHSEDPASLDPSTRQRLVDTFALPADLTPAAVTVAADVIEVRWPADPTPSVVSLRRLAEAAGLGPSPAPRLWSAGSLPDAPRFPHAAVMAGDDGLRAWLEAVEELGFGLVVGTPTDPAAIEALARRVAYPRDSIFGAMWKLSSAVTDHEDSAYSTSFLEPHTDGTYTIDAPGLQLFACREREGTGGESILVDGFAAAERLRAEDPAAFDLLASIDVPCHYLEPGVHLRAARPVLRTGADGRLIQVSFNNYDRAPFVLPSEVMARWYDAYTRFHALCNDRSHWLEVGLTPGVVLLFDNWRVLHGRMAYTGTRVFEGCYHNREDFESRLRVLRHAG